MNIYGSQIVTNNATLRVLGALEERGPVNPEGKGGRTSCPNPDHPDRHPSFFLYPGGGGRCFSQCSRYWSSVELAHLLGISVDQPREGLTLADIAGAKGLGPEVLQSYGVTEGVTGTGRNRVPCVDIPYTDQHGEVVAVRKRLSLDGIPRFSWRRGDHPTLYGLQHLEEIRRVGWVILVEGESDAWTLWHQRIPSLGIPGASMWRHNFGTLLRGLKIFLWCEPDQGGDTLIKAVVADIPEVRIIDAPSGVKDPSELYLQAPDLFKERMNELAKAAKPASEMTAEAHSAEARECLEEAKGLLERPNIIQDLASALSEQKYAGDTRPAIMAYVAITSRLLENPLNLAYISMSAAGKNAAIDASQPFFPESAYYLVRLHLPGPLYTTTRCSHTAW